MTLMSAIGLPLLPADDWGRLLLEARGSGGPHDAVAALLPALWLGSLVTGLLLLGTEATADG